MKFVVAPAVYPRVFEILTTLKFGALRTKHIVSTAFETITKKRKKNKNKETSWSMCSQPCLMNRQQHNRSLKGMLRGKKNKIRRP